MKVPDTFIGIPYKDRGQSFDGCDCWGLVTLFHSELLGRNLSTPLYSGAHGPEVPDLIQQGWVEWEKVDLRNTRFGDVIALRIGKIPVHCGVVINGDFMLHILEGRDSCIEPYSSGFWFRCIARIGRWKS
jgi:cell wall-associated NlpC family hydrolase